MSSNGQQESLGDAMAKQKTSVSDVVVIRFDHVTNTNNL